MSHATDAVLIERTADPERAAHRYAGAFIAGFSSAETRRAYRRDLTSWFEFCRRWDLDPINVHRSHVDVYARELEQTAYSNSTRARRLSTLRAFFNWLVEEEVLLSSPASRVKLPKQHRPPMPSLNKHELHRFLNACDEAIDTQTVPKPRARGRHANPRPLLTLDERAGILIMGLAALRVSEVCDLDVADIYEERHMYVARVIGKGDKERIVAMPSRAMVALTQTIDARAAASGPLLLNKHGARMQPPQLQAAVRVVAELAGLGERGLTPHALRRSWTEISLQEKIHVRDVQRHLGHASLSTTQWYDRTELTPERSPVWAVQAAVA